MSFWLRARRMNEITLFSLSLQVDPLETGFEVDLEQRGLPGVGPVEILDEPLDAGVHRILGEVPVEAVVVVPLAPLRELRAHEHQLLAGMCA